MDEVVRSQMRHACRNLAAETVFGVRIKGIAICHISFEEAGQFSMLAERQNLFGAKQAMQQKHQLHLESWTSWATVINSFPYFVIAEDRITLKPQQRGIITYQSLWPATRDDPNNRHKVCVLLDLRHQQRFFHQLALRGSGPFGVAAFFHSFSSDDIFRYVRVVPIRQQTFPHFA